MINWTSEFVTELKEDEVFVFGSNDTGFHGAGTAGLAFRGPTDKNWRRDPEVLEAIERLKKNPNDNKVGRWAIWGIGRGSMMGWEGNSYAIATVKYVGAKKSITRREIYNQLIILWAKIKTNPDLTYLITPLGEGYAGWTREEMNEVWEFLVKTHGLPSNVKFIGRKQ
jgi:hypothetical protein